MRNIVIDIETDLEWKTIWLVVTKNIDNGEVKSWTEAKGLLDYLKPDDVLIGHNIIGFDLPILRKLWKLNTKSNQFKDTLIMSRLHNPVIENGHSLDAWGVRLGLKKGDFSDFDKGFTNEMLEYCIQDVEITHKLFERLSNDLLDWGISTDLEHSVAVIIQEQKEKGFKLDVKKCMALLVEWKKRLEQIEEDLQKVFKPIVTKRISEKTGKPLKDHVEVFNPASRKQIAERMMALGWKPKKHTEKGSVIVDEKVLETIDYPEAKLISEYLLVQKRVAQVESWLENTDNSDRVHGSVITNGAITGRMTHNNPNMAQVPRVGSPFGLECRSCWTVDNGKVLVGADAAQLELRLLASYMNDPEYTREILEGDIHTKNMKAAGLTNRDQAKTFIYAFLYGAGATKIGSIVGGNHIQGKELIDKFLANTPALNELRKKVDYNSSKGWLKGLDGRRLHIRSQHAALNTLLQGAGAIVMKQGLILLQRKLKNLIIDAHFVANVHDEWQIETNQELADTVGVLAVQSIRQAGSHLGLNCPLDGEFKVGKNWAETH